MQRSRQLAVADAAVDRHGAGGAVELEDARHPAQRDEFAAGVGDVVEGVPRPERPERPMAAHDLLKRFEAGGLVETRRDVRMIA